MFCRKCGRKLKHTEMRCRICGEPVDTAGICGGFRGLVHTNQLSLAHGGPGYSDDWTGPGVRFEDIISGTDLAESRRSEVKPESGRFPVSERSLSREEHCFDSRTDEFSQNKDAQDRMSSQSEKGMPADRPQDEIPADNLQEDPGKNRGTVSARKTSIAAACFCIAAAAVITLFFFPGLFAGSGRQTEVPDSHMADHKESSADRAENSSIPDHGKAHMSPANLPQNPDGSTVSQAYTAEKMVQTDKNGSGAAKEKTYSASAAERAAEKSLKRSALSGDDSENGTGEEKADGSSVYVRRIFAGTDHEQENLKDFLKENNLFEEYQREQNHGQSISIKTWNRSALSRIEKVEYRSASGDEDGDGTDHKRTTLKYDYLTDDYGAPGQLEKKTVEEKGGSEKPRKMILSYMYENAGWGRQLIVEETCSNNKFKAEGFSKDKITRYTYEYNDYYDEYNLVRKEYLENDEPARGSGGALAVEYSGYEKPRGEGNEYCITETYVTLSKGGTEPQKGSIRIGSSSFDEVRYYYDGSTYRLKKLKYFKKGQNVKGPQGFHSMECITADSLYSRIENYYDPRNNPIAIHGDEIFQSWQDLYLLSESEFKILFFRKDIQE